VKGDIGAAIPLGITDGGSLLYGLWTGMRDVYTAAVDLETGRVLTRPERISKRLVGVSQEPHWSPDGMQLAYVVEQSRVLSQKDRLLCINSTETGDSRCRALEGLPGIFFPRWSPDGRAISIYDSGATGTRRRVCLVDPGTGTVTALRDLEGISLSGVYERQGVWTPDGKGIVLWRCNTDAGVQQLLRCDIETKQEKELFRATFPPSIAQNPDEMAFSPDHRWLAFRSKEQEPQTLSVMPADGGEPRVLVRVDREQGIQSVTWTPDGKSVLFSRRLGESGRSGIFRVALEGGEPIRFDVEMDSISSLGVHPDGKRIVFQSGTSSVEIWVLENFLPTLAATAGGSGP
jgi:Tol biopolymer transport system component